MQHPEFVYYAAMFLVALPMAAAFRNVVALVVFATWAVGQTLYLVGMPEPETQAVLYLVALVVGCVFARSTACLFAAVLFLPLAVVSATDMMGWTAPVEAWWSIFWVAMLQVLALPFCADWRAAWTRWRTRLADSGGTGMLRLAHR